MKHRKKTWLAAYLAVLMAFSVYFLLDTFVITRVYSAEGTGITSSQLSQTASSSESPQNASSIGDTESSKDTSSASSTNDAANSTTNEAESSASPLDDELSATVEENTDSKSSSNSSKNSGKSGSSASNALKNTATPVVTDSSYTDENISVSIKEYRVNDTTIYVADVYVSSADYLKTALARGVYGKNVTATTSDTADSVDAILAINGDYYGAQTKGYVIRNGVLYRSTSDGGEDLVIYKDGTFGIINENEVTAEQLLASGAQQVLSFGPALVENGQIAVTSSEEVGKAMASNPRTAIGIVEEGHYLFVVADGRTNESEGLSLYELAQVMKQLGAKTAYNLDGGGSSTIYFNGEVINNPTTSGRSSSERKVSDIVYIGY